MNGMTAMSIRSIRSRVVEVPLAMPSRTGAGAMTSFPFVLVDLVTDEGIIGSTYVFAYTRHAARPLRQIFVELDELLQGGDAAPNTIQATLAAHFRLLGVQGLLYMAASALDIAAWDAQAKARNVALANLLGGVPKPIPAYASFFMNGVAGATRDGETAMDAGFRAVKVKIGYPDVATDVSVLRALRSVVGAEVAIMVDYNQCLSVDEALMRARRLEEFSPAWIEEPTRADDAEGHARISKAITTPVQLGENWWGVGEMARSIAVRASRLAMVNVIRIGGVTGWQAAAVLAAQARLPLSSHTYQTVCSQLLSVSPTAHWLECSGKANPLIAAQLTIEAGMAVTPSVPGNGLIWNEDYIARHRLD